MPRKRNRLTKMMFDEVSLVDRGANQHAEIILSKRKDDDMGDSLFSRIIEKNFGESETLDDPDGIIDDMEDDVAKFGFQGPPQGQPMGPPGAGPNMPGGPGMVQPQLPPEVVQYIQQLEQYIAQMQGQGPQSNAGGQENNVNPFGKSYDDLDEDDISFLEELSKNLEDEEVRDAISKANELISKANERAEAAEEIAKQERDHRLTQEWVSKARAYTSLPVDADEFGPVLKKLHETLDEEEFGVIDRALSSSNETLATAGLFSSVGKSGSNEFGVISKLDAKAAELVEKSEDMTLEQARERVLEENPSLYDEYLNEAR